MLALPACSFHSSVVNMEKWCFVPCGHGVLGNGGLLPSLRCGDPSNHSSATSFVLAGIGREGSSVHTVARALWPGLTVEDNSSALPHGPKYPSLICLPQCDRRISRDFSFCSKTGEHKLPAEQVYEAKPTRVLLCPWCHSTPSTTPYPAQRFPQHFTTLPSLININFSHKFYFLSKLWPLHFPAFLLPSQPLPPTHSHPSSCQRCCRMRAGCALPTHYCVSQVCRGFSYSSHSRPGKTMRNVLYFKTPSLFLQALGAFITSKLITASFICLFIYSSIQSIYLPVDIF